MDKNSPDVVAAYAQAKQALGRAHAPYSKLHVASAIRIKGQKQAIVGVNVENASFGGTICAERSAVVSMVSQFGASSIEFVIVISSHDGSPIPPCGMCLQVLSEFVDDHCPIFLGDANDLQAARPFKDYLPLAFKSEALPD